MALIDKNKFSLNPAEMTALLQQAEPQAMVEISELRQRNNGLSNQELARQLERNFVRRGGASADASAVNSEQDFLQNTAAYVCAISKLYDKELQNHGSNADLLGTVLNVAKQIDKAEDATEQGVSFLSNFLAERVPALNRMLGKVLPDDVVKSLENFSREPEKVSKDVSGAVSNGMEVAAAALVALATRRALKESYGIELPQAAQEPEHKDNSDDSSDISAQASQDPKDPPSDGIIE